MIKYTFLSLFISAYSYTQTYQSALPRDKQTLISIEREYDYSQGNANEIGQQEYIFSPNKEKLIEILGKSVNGLGNISLTRKESIEYDAQDRINRVIEWEKNENGILAITEEILYQYNASNNPTEIIRNEYDPNTNSFYLKEKYTLHYTPDGKITQIQWYDDLDELTIDDTFTYNSQNQVENFLRVNGNGEDIERRAYQYIQGVCTGYIAETPDSNGNWQNSHKIVLEYDTTNENITAETHYSYTNGTWVEGLKIEYQHDSQKLSSQTYTYKNYLHYIGTNDWFSSKNTISSADHHTYDSTNSEWQRTKMVTFTYIDNAPLSVKESIDLQSNKTYLYPNPTHEYFKIHSKKNISGDILLIDTSGKIVRTYKAHEKEFSVLGLEKGLYFVQTNQETIQLIIQ